MAIKLTRSDAVADAIASVRMEGLAISASHRGTLDQLASGKLSAADARRAILSSIDAPTRGNAVARKKAVAR